MPSSSGPHWGRRFAPRVAILGLLVIPAGLLGQAAPADSVELLEEVHELQEEFERYRESRTPVQPSPSDGACDERIGRICIWFGGEEGEAFPAELREVGQARVEFIRALFDAFEQVHDRWILGQLVHYLLENRNPEGAERVATECGIVET